MNLYLVSVYEECTISTKLIYVLAESLERAIVKVKEKKQYRNIVDVQLIGIDRFDKYNPVDSLIL